MAPEEEFKRFGFEEFDKYYDTPTGDDDRGEEQGDEATPKKSSGCACCLRGCGCGCLTGVLALLILGSIVYWNFSSLFSEDPVVVRRNFANILDIRLPPGFEPRSSFEVPRNFEKGLTVLATKVPLEQFRIEGIEKHVAITVSRIITARNDPELELLLIVTSYRLGTLDRPVQVDLLTLEVGKEKYNAHRVSWVTEEGVSVVRYLVRVQDTAFLIVAGPKKEISPAFVENLIRGVVDREPDLPVSSF